MSGPSRASASSWIWLSIAAAVVTMALKSVAAALSGSVGVLSDALESGVNLTAALVTMFALRWSAQPPDAEHPFGHAKGELLAALLEGLLVLVAGGAIAAVAVNRFVHPIELASAPLGLVLTVVATVVNGAVGLTLVRVGKRLQSTALEADGHHLMTDVWSSVGVIVGRLGVLHRPPAVVDPVAAVVVAVLVLGTGVRILQQAMGGPSTRSSGQLSAPRSRPALRPFRDRGIDLGHSVTLRRQLRLHSLDAARAGSVGHPSPRAGRRSRTRRRLGVRTVDGRDAH